MYHVFSYDGLSTWISVESDNVYIARCLVLIYYHFIKNITYIGEFDNLNEISKILPENFMFDSYDYETYQHFKNEYSFNFIE